MFLLPPRTLHPRPLSLQHTLRLVSPTPRGLTLSPSIRRFSRRTRLPLQQRLPFLAMLLLSRRGVQLVCPLLSYFYPLTYEMRTARPTPQPSGSHSKLVTAKLTSTAQLSTTTTPGWSRPSSATPPVSATPSGSSNAPPQTHTSTPAAHHLPHAGKVIQPQPRRAIVSSSSLVKKDSSSIKPAWGNAKSLSVNVFTDNARNDFPTAAEVAQG
jgi:hypothetical protein